MKWTDKNLMNIHRFKMQSDKYKFTASPTITTIIQIIKKKLDDKYYDPKYDFGSD